MTIWHAMLAASLDGKIARRDGAVDWLDPYPAEDFDFAGFVAGGGEVLRALAATGKRDLLDPAVIPLVLGDGIAPFPSPTVELKLKLTACVPMAKGVVRLTYARA